MQAKYFILPGVAWHRPASPGVVRRRPVSLVIVALRIWQRHEHIRNDTHQSEFILYFYVLGTASLDLVFTYFSINYKILIKKN